MNIFRMVGDLLHLVSILILLFKIRRTKNCMGISLKTQELYALVFVTRYLDLFYNFLSLYNTLMKIFYLLATFGIIYLMRFKYKASYDKEHDNFRVLFLIAPCAVLALLINQELTFFEVLWTFSVYLEAVAILPQLFLLQRTGEAENMTADYMFCLGMYRTFYIVNWGYRYYYEGTNSFG
eukprot:TRINITY_DN6670_c0_g1_i2.p2 TRINITY_DN6670_c0_g1~~TRINITY_DN6670_c0_g1_i2.p2  ORF type:complete len:200 (+),score=0.81 TRINITY_DN6670_c0_g1_i2:61-600(+)